MALATTPGMPRVVAAVVLALSLASGGCTVAGTAIGAASPRYERANWPRDGVELGTEIRVRQRSVGADAVEVREIDGRYGGIRDGWMSVTDHDGREHEVAVRDIVDLRVRNGSHWQKGLLLGAAADAVIVTAAIAIANGANVSIATGR
jgi:hypothetical protein